MREARPDFVIIGAMKCATSTLHEQLAAQAGVFMTTPKEPCFFSDDDVYAKGMGWYHGLFSGAGEDDVRGESSTHYTKLPTHPEAVPRMREAYAEMKLVYVMRHPIKRLVSQFVHEWSVRKIDPSTPIDKAVERHAELVEYGRYAAQLRPWMDAYGPGSILPVFSERLRAAPDEELARVARFVGIEGEVRWSASTDAQNRGAERLRKSRARDALLRAPVLSTVRKRLVPKSWRDRAKGLWRMKETPELSPETAARLAEVYDADLRELGRWLGADLRCETFEETVSNRSLEWSSETAMSGGAAR